jgi:CheY-like chemotaxis protein
LAQAQPLDLVVCGIHRPNMNGLEPLEAMAATDALRHTTALPAAAEARRKDIVRAAQIGAALRRQATHQGHVEDKVQKARITGAYRA